MKRGPFPDLSLTCPLPEPSFTYISKSQIKRAHYSFPNRAPKERALHFELSFIYILQGSQQRRPHSRLASKSFHWERCSISKSLVNKPPRPHSPTGPLWKELLISRTNGLFFHSYLSESPVKELSDKAGRKHMFNIQKTPHEDGMLTDNWDVTWFSKGIIYNTAITTPVPCIL